MIGSNTVAQVFVQTWQAIPQPANWPGGVAWNPNQYDVIAMTLDGNQASQRRDVFAGTPRIIVLDEAAVTPGTATNNLPLVDQLFNSLSQLDVYGLKRFWVDANGALWQRAGWVRAPGTYTPNPAADTQMTPIRSPEKAAFEDNLQQAITDLNTVLNTPPANLAGLYVYVQKVATIQKRLLQLLARLFRPDTQPPG